MDVRVVRVFFFADFLRAGLRFAAVFFFFAAGRFALADFFADLRVAFFLRVAMFCLDSI